MIKEISKKDTFDNFLSRKGAFTKALTEKETQQYRGDHLTKQIDYFNINGNPIEYNRILRFENLKTELELLINDLSLGLDFFEKKVNIGEKKITHYSKFYNRKRKNKLKTLYKEDIEFLNYSFKDKRNVFDYLNFFKPSYDLI